MLVLGSELACPKFILSTSVTATALTFGQALDSTVAGGFISYERQSKFPQQSYSGRSWILPTWRPHQELYIKQQPNRKKHMKPSDHYTSSRPVRWEMPRVPRSLWSCACPGQICLGDPWQRLTGLSALRGLHWVDGSTLLMKNVQISTDMILIWWNFPNGPFMLNG